MNELLPYDNLRKVLEEYAEQAKEIYKYQISLGAHNASRSLTDTIQSHVVVGETAYEVTLDLNYYWKYLEVVGRVRSHPLQEQSSLPIDRLRGQSRNG